MSKQVAVKQTEDLNATALAIQTEAKERAAALQELGVEAKDLVIASIQVMQGTSALVGDDKAKLGEIVNMQTEEVIGGVDKPVKILPLKMYKTLRVYDVTDSFKFMREETLTEENSKLPNEGKEDDKSIKRYHTMNYFVLLKTDMDKGEGFPCLIRFRSTGMQAGRDLATYLYKAVFFKKKPYANFVNLLTKKEKKDTNTFGVPVIDTKAATPASPAEMKVAEEWLAMLAAGNYKIDQNEDPVENEVVTPHKQVVPSMEVVGKEHGAY